MKIGIIGTGPIGSTLAKKLGNAGHEIKVTSKSSEHELSETAKKLGVGHSSLQDVAKDVDIVIVAIPTSAIPTLPKNLFEGISDKVIVVDTSNYYPTRDGIMPVFDNQLESVWVSEQLGRPVVKAFNNLLAYSLENEGRPNAEDNRVAMAISGDDENAKKIISQLIDEVGFDAVDSGNLSESWRHQPGMPSYCTELNAKELTLALADKDEIKRQAATLRDKSMEIFMSLTEPPTHEYVLNTLRSLFPTNPKR